MLAAMSMRDCSQGTDSCLENVCSYVPGSWQASYMLTLRGMAVLLAASGTLVNSASSLATGERLTMPAY